MKNTYNDFIFCDNCIIKTQTGFRYLAKEQIETLNFEKACIVYKRGDIVYHEGHKGGGVYCVNKGVLKLYKTGLDGKEQIIRFAKPGELIGYRSILSDEPSCTSARVLEDAVLCYIPAKIFIDLATKNSDFSMFLSLIHI